jgi:probable phosphoglycerate mutase
MPSETQLIVVRHGETTWNIESRQQGWLDSPLTNTGLAQAHAIAEALAREPIDALYSSDLGRAEHTAQIIARRIGRDVVTDERLRERHLGALQGLTMDVIRRDHADVWASLGHAGPDYAPPGGESDAQRRERVIACLEQVAAAHAGRTAAVVAHGGTLSAALRHTLGVQSGAGRCYRLFNASINRFFVEDGRWTLGSWGETLHLGQIGAIDDQ